MKKRHYTPQVPLAVGPTGSAKRFALSSLKKAKVEALFFDIDDTLTTHGKLTKKAYNALWMAHDAGLQCVPVTGRPAGWCDHFARMWPVAGVVGENGACAFYHDGKKLRRLDVLGAAARAENRKKLTRLGKRILAAVPGCALASDQAFREYDLAIDFCEDVPPLPKTEIDRIVALFEAAGCTAKVSSIHVNGWFGRYDKLSMTQRLAREVLGIRVARGMPGCVFVGDSPNDQPMFAAFDLSVGVANICSFLPHLYAQPKFVTRSMAGDGFSEVVRALCHR